jgi:hypothetical protein
LASEPFSSLSLGSSLKRNSYSGFVGIQNVAKRLGLPRPIERRLYLENKKPGTRPGFLLVLTAGFLQLAV